MKPIEDYMATYSRAKSREARRQAMRLFLAMKYPEEGDYEEKAARYLKEMVNPVHDLMHFRVEMERQGKAVLTQANYLQGVKGFLAYHGREISDGQWKSQVWSKLPKAKRPVTDEKPFDTAALREILQHAPIQLRALVLMMCSSGMRLGEALQIRFSDIDLASVPAVVNIPAAFTKTGGKRKTFLSAEAVDALRTWEKFLPQYRNKAASRRLGKNRGPMVDRVFPFSDMNAQTMWANAVKRTGLFEGEAMRDETTHHLRMHLHMCRKFFRTFMPTAGVPVDVVEALMGHEGYLTAVYRQYPNANEMLAKFYLQGEPAVTIAKTSSALRETESRVRMQAEEIENQRRENARLAATLAELTERFAAIEAVVRASNTVVTAENAAELDAVTGAYENWDELLKGKKRG